MKGITFNRVMFLVNTAVAAASIYVYAGAWGSAPNFTLHAALVSVAAVLVAITWLVGCGVKDGRAAIRFTAIFLLLWTVTAVGAYYLVTIEIASPGLWDMRDAFNREWFIRFALLFLAPALTLTVTARLRSEL